MINTGSFFPCYVYQILWNRSRGGGVFILWSWSEIPHVCLMLDTVEFLSGFKGTNPQTHQITYIRCTEECCHESRSEVKQKELRVFTAVVYRETLMVNFEMNETPRGYVRVLRASQLSGSTHTTQRASTVFKEHQNILNLLIPLIWRRSRKTRILSEIKRILQLESWPQQFLARIQKSGRYIPCVDVTAVSLHYSVTTLPYRSEIF